MDKINVTNILKKYKMNTKNIDNYIVDIICNILDNNKTFEDAININDFIYVLYITIKNSKKMSVNVLLDSKNRKKMEYTFQEDQNEFSMFTLRNQEEQIIIDNYSFDLKYNNNENEEKKTVYIQELMKEVLKHDLVQKIDSFESSLKNTIIQLSDGYKIDFYNNHNLLHIFGLPYPFILHKIVEQMINATPPIPFIDNISIKSNNNNNKSESQKKEEEELDDIVNNLLNTWEKNSNQAMINEIINTKEKIINYYNKYSKNNNLSKNEYKKIMEWIDSIKCFEDRLNKLKFSIQLDDMYNYLNSYDFYLRVINNKIIKSTDTNNNTPTIDIYIENCCELPNNYIKMLIDKGNNNIDEINDLRKKLNENFDKDFEDFKVIRNIEGITENQLTIMRNELENKLNNKKSKNGKKKLNENQKKALKEEVAKKIEIIKEDFEKKLTTQKEESFNIINLLWQDKEKLLETPLSDYQKRILKTILVNNYQNKEGYEQIIMNEMMNYYEIDTTEITKIKVDYRNELKELINDINHSQNTKDYLLNNFAQDFYTIAQNNNNSFLTIVNKNDDLLDSIWNFYDSKREFFPNKKITRDDLKKYLNLMDKRNIEQLNGISSVASLENFLKNLKSNNIYHLIIIEQIKSFKNDPVFKTKYPVIKYLNIINKDYLNLNINTSSINLKNTNIDTTNKNINAIYEECDFKISWYNLTNYIKNKYKINGFDTPKKPDETKNDPKKYINYLIIFKKLLINDLLPKEITPIYTKIFWKLKHIENIKKLKDVSYGFFYDDEANLIIDNSAYSLNNVSIKKFDGTSQKTDVLRISSVKDFSSQNRKNHLFMVDIIYPIAEKTLNPKNKKMINDDMNQRYFHKIA